MMSGSLRTKRIRRKAWRWPYIADTYLRTREDPAQRGERVLSIPAYYFGVPHHTHPGQRSNYACVDLVQGRMFDVELGVDWVRIYVWPQRARSGAYTRALAHRYLASFERDDAALARRDAA